MEYTLFNIKTDYYLLKSLIKIDDLINFSLQKNIKSIAICDDNLSGVIEFYKKCHKNNIKPIVGLELTNDNNILFLYAKSYKGYENLMKINTLKEQNQLSNIELIKYSADLICVINYKALESISNYSFYDDFYIGYQTGNEKKNALILTDKVVYNPNIKMFSQKDEIYLEYLNKLGGENNLNEKNYYELLDETKLKEQHSIIDKIDFKFPEKKMHIPVFDSKKDSNEYLRALSTMGLSKRLNSNIPDKYTKRLDHELNIIKEIGFVDYFLIVYDYVKYAKKNDVLVGPGRGSAAGSLVCYSIGITDIDPIKYGLLFERFLNKDRVSMPDIDIDFDSEKRNLIIDYVRDKYGKSKVAVGLTYNTYKAKLILREIAKIMNIDNILFEKFIKVIEANKTLKVNLENINVKKYLDNYAQLKELYKVSLRLENLKKNISTHAAGIVICSNNLDDVIPVKVTNEVYQAGYTMDHLEDLGILKMDFLGLKNLTIISNILKEIELENLNDIDLNDKLVIDVFRKVETDGIFQYETFTMKKLLEKLRPNNFNEIVAAVALVRPGPSEFLDEYIKNKDNISGIIYLSSDLKDILEETYGIILYQEQIIKIFVRVGQYTLNEADTIRKAISKKNREVLINSREKFISGAVKNGYNKNTALSIFDKIVKFAGYGFPKAHSVAYALIAYQMAYLKVYYKIHFINELLKETKNKESLEKFYLELKNSGIKVYKPDVNYSKERYYIEKNQLILPLDTINGITTIIGREIVDKKPYTDIFDFIIKNKELKAEILKRLILSGALRSFKYNSNTLISNLDILKNYASLNGYGEKPILKIYEEFDDEYLISKDLEYYGFYIGNHPASKYKNRVKLNNIKDNLFKNEIFYVVVENYRKIKTKKNDDMAFVNISDETGKFTAVIFSDNIHKLEDIKNGDLVKLSGKISKSYDKLSIIINDIKKERTKSEQ